MPNFYAYFADWRSRPGREDSFRTEKRQNFLTDDAWRREYPETIEDTLLAAEDMVFPTWAIEAAITEPGPAQPVNTRQGKIPPHRYNKAWDIGRLHDAVVGTVLDITTTPYVLVNYYRTIKQPFPATQELIAGVHTDYKNGVTYIEDNNAGMAVRENLKVPASGFNTTQANKVAMLMALKVALEQGWLKIYREPQLIFELQSYMWDDEGLVQDSVISLAANVWTAGPPIWTHDRATGTNSAGRLADLHTHKRQLQQTGTVERPASRVSLLSTPGKSRRSSGNGQLIQRERDY